MTDHEGNGQTQRQQYRHQPVMCRQVIEVLRAIPDGVVVDATLGGAGHAAALLDAHPGVALVGIDRDSDALTVAAQRLAVHGDRVTLCHANFADIGALLDQLGHETITGCLFDLGVSSPQLDRAERGFGYRKDGPLDMRMDQSRGISAADIVNHVDEVTLSDILRRNADERHARRIARAIVAQRPVTTTSELAAIIRKALPAQARRRGHPARRTFQAIRIAVNDELTVLDPALTAAVHRLAPAGRCAVLSYHSGEDRVVKMCFRREAGEAPPQLPGLPPPPGSAVVRLLWRGTRTPDPDEMIANPRCTAARLRAVERLDRFTPLAEVA